MKRFIQQFGTRGRRELVIIPLVICSICMDTPGGNCKSSEDYPVNLAGDWNNEPAPNYMPENLHTVLDELAKFFAVGSLSEISGDSYYFKFKTCCEDTEEEAIWETSWYSYRCSDASATISEGSDVGNMAAYIMTEATTANLTEEEIASVYSYLGTLDFNLLGVTYDIETNFDKDWVFKDTCVFYDETYTCPFLGREEHNLTAAGLEYDSPWFGFHILKGEFLYRKVGIIISENLWYMITTRQQASSMYRIGNSPEVECFLVNNNPPPEVTLITEFKFTNLEDIPLPADE